MTVGQEQKGPWIKLDPEALTEAQREEVPHSQPDVKIQLSVSPYDVPEAVRGFFTDSGKSFVIEFKYLDDEPKEERPADHEVTLHIGKNSGRLYKIQVNVEALEPDVSSVGLELRVIDVAENALRRFANESERQKNVSVARNVLADHEQELVRTAAGS